jgi:hypothetical protein
MDQADSVLSTPRRSASKIKAKKRAKVKRSATATDAKLFAATDLYLAALSKYAASALAFGEVEFIKPRPRGYVSKERAYLRTMDHFGKMERKLVAIRSKTLDGLFAKARALEADRYVSEDLRESILKDVLGMKPGRGKAVAS